MRSDQQLDRVRRICLALPEASERLSHGMPTFFTGKKVLANFADNHHNDGHLAIWLPAPDGAQAGLIGASPHKFYRPAYVGHRGWVGIELAEIDDDELIHHIHTAWRLVATKRALKAFAEKTSGR